MKRILILAIVLMTGMVGIAQASHGNVGLGIQIGEPTGLTGKFWLDRQNAIDATVGWNIHNDWMEAQAGYLFHFPLDVNTGNLYAYVGIGGLIKVWGSSGDDDGDVSFAGRIPLGLDFIYNPVSFYAELDPLIFIIPRTDFDIGGGIGFRFYF